jgi:hypothetical protein
MKRHLQCPACNSYLETDGDVLGQKIRCQECGESFIADCYSLPPDSDCDPPPAKSETGRGKLPVKFKAGRGKMSDAYHLTTTDGLFVRLSDTLKFNVVPEWCLPASLVILAGLSVFIGLGGLIVYAIIYSAFNLFAQRPVELRLSAQEILIDWDRKVLGVRKRRRGRHCLMVFRLDPHTEAAIAGIPVVESQIKRASKLQWHLLALGISALGGVFHSLY